MASVTIQNLDKVLANLDPAKARLPLRRFLTRASLVVQKQGKIYAPVKTGRTRNSIYVQVGGAFPAMYGKIGTNVSHKGFPYPAALNASGKYHYRRGAHTGQSTLGWFTSKALNKSRPGIARWLKAFAEELIRAMGG